MTNDFTSLQQVQEFFFTHGYAVVKNIVPASTIKDVHTFLSGHTQNAVEAAKKELCCETTAALVNVGDHIASGHGSEISALTKATRDTLTGHYPLPVRLSQELWKIPLLNGILEILKMCLKSDHIFMHMPPTARFVLPENDHAGVPPHQDASYNGHLISFLTMWVPLVNITDTCGGVVIYEGTGNSPIQGAPDSPQAYWRKAVETKNYPAKHMTIEAGDILLLNPQIIHGSAANQSEGTRISIDYRFFGNQSSSSKHYLDLQTCSVYEPSLLNPRL